MGGYGNGCDVDQYLMLARAILANDLKIIDTFRTPNLGMYYSLETPLLIALMHGTVDAVKLLLKNGAYCCSNFDNRSVFYDKTHPVLVAIKSGDPEKVDMIVKAYCGDPFPSQTLNYVVHSNANMARAVLSKGRFDINIRFGPDETYLMVAAACNDIEMVKTLVEFGANPNLRDMYGRTAADYADAEGKHYENIVQCLSSK